MTRRYVTDLRDGDLVDEVFLVADKQLRANRNAALYLTVDLRDRTGVVNGRMWNVLEESCNHIQVGGFVRTRGKVQVFQGTLQMILTHIDAVPVSSIDPVDFESMTSQKIEDLFVQLRAIMLGFEDPQLRMLMECFLLDDSLMRLLAETPAGVKAHHAYRGGLIEHVVSLMQIAKKMCEVYVDLNAELLLAGIFLHDIGKLRELSCTAGFVNTD